MSDVTTSAVDTVQAELDKADPNTLADALRLVKLGTMVAPLKRVFTGLISGTVFDLTAIDGTGETAGAANPNRLAALVVHSLRDAHSNIVVDAGGAAVASTATYPGTVLISDDGKTLTFAGAITAFTIEYVPRASVSMTSTWAGQE